MKEYIVSKPIFRESIRITDTTDPAHADNINAAPKQLLENTLVNQEAISRLEKSAGMVDEYNISATYQEGDYCMYNGVLYKCLQNITEGGEWNPEAWGATNALEEIGALKAALSELNSKIGNTYWLYGGTQIGENDNLNDYTIPGNYYCSTNVLASTLQNCPIKTAFILKVERAAGVSYPCQTIREFVTGRTFYRMVADSNTWRDWRSAAMSYDLPNYDFSYTDVTMDVNVGLTEVPNITGMEYIPVILRANVAYDGISVYGRMHSNTWVIESNHAQNITIRFFKYPN